MGTYERKQNMARMLNKALCLHCGTTIHSKHRHHFVTCKCKEQEKQVSVDGGKDYIRRAFGNKAKWVEYWDDGEVTLGHTCEKHPSSVSQAPQG